MSSGESMSMKAATCTICAIPFLSAVAKTQLRAGPRRVWTCRQTRRSAKRPVSAGHIGATHLAPNMHWESPCTMGARMWVDLVA